MVFHSIRWRLQIWHGLILVLVLAGFGFTAHRLQRGNEMRRVDQELQQRLGPLLNSQRRPPPGDRPDGPPPGSMDNRPEEERGFARPMGDVAVITLPNCLMARKTRFILLSGTGKAWKPSDQPMRPLS